MGVPRADRFEGEATFCVFPAPHDDLGDFRWMCRPRRFRGGRRGLAHFSFSYCAAHVEVVRLVGQSEPDAGRYVRAGEASLLE